MIGTTIIIRPSDVREDKLTADDLETIIGENDVGDLVHLPSGELSNNFGGKTTWFTPYAPNPHVFTRPDLFPHLDSVVWYQVKNEALANSSMPLVVDGIGNVDNKGQIRFTDFQEYLRFLEDRRSFGWVRLIGSRENEFGKLETYREELTAGLHPKILLVTPYYPRLFGLPNSKVEEAIAEGRPIFFANEQDLREDNKVEYYKHRDFLRGLWREAQKRHHVLPIGEGHHSQPTAGFDAHKLIKENGRFVYAGDSPPYARKEVKNVKDEPDERLAEIVDRLTFEASQFCRLPVTFAHHREGSVIYYAYAGESPKPVDLYRFMSLRTNNLDSIVQDLFEIAVRNSAHLIKVAERALTPEEVGYIKKVNGDGSAEAIANKLGIPGHNFLEAYQKSIGYLKAPLMKKFGKVVTDRYTANFVVGGFTEDPEGTLKQVGKPGVYIVDPDKLQYDLAQRDISKLLYAPNNGFDQEKIKRFSDLYFDTIGFYPRDKEDYETGLSIANFERHHSWALTLLGKKAAKSASKAELESSLQEAAYHFNIGRLAEDEIEKVLREKNGLDASRHMNYVRKALHENFYAKLHEVVERKIGERVVSPNDRANIHYRLLGFGARR